jgi:hypothetical protein
VVVAVVVFAYAIRQFQTGQCTLCHAFSGMPPALHQKSFLYRIFWNKNRPLWSRKSLHNETEKVLLTGGSVY